MAIEPLSGVYGTCRTLNLLFMATGDDTHPASTAAVMSTRAFMSAE